MDSNKPAQYAYGQPIPSAQEQEGGQGNAPRSEMRALDDWELVLVGGGDGVPCW